MLALHFTVGFAVSFVGSLPLGMLNLTAVDLGLRRRLRDVVQFALAVASVESIQVLVSVMASTWFVRRPQVESVLQVAAVPRFLILGLIHLRKAGTRALPGTPRRQMPAFALGASLAAINPLAMPFWIFWLSFLHGAGWLEFSVPGVAALVAGIHVGTTAPLILFGKAGRAISSRRGGFSNWITHAIAVVFFALAIGQCVRVVLRDPGQSVSADGSSQGGLQP